MDILRFYPRPLSQVNLARPAPGSQGTRGPVIGVPWWRSHRASADERLVSPVVEHARQSETNWRAHTRGARTSAPTIPGPKKDSRAIKTRIHEKKIPSDCLPQGPWRIGDVGLTTR